MAEDYPRYPDIHDLDLTLLNPRMIVVRRGVPQGCSICCCVYSRLWVIPHFLLQDVTPYMNPSPFTVSPNTHVSQVFNLFRTMGLRHLPVVNAVGEVSGLGVGGGSGVPGGLSSVLPVDAFPYARPSSRGHLVSCLPFSRACSCPGSRCLLTPLLCVSWHPLLTGGCSISRI